MTSRSTPATFAGKAWTHLDILLVRVETDEGLLGWGEAFGHAGIQATRAALDGIVAPLVLAILTSLCLARCSLIRDCQGQ